MSSLFELEDRVRRLREALAYMKRTTLANEDELRAMAQGSTDAGASEEWRLFLAELRDYASVAEAVGSASVRPRKRSGRPSLGKLAPKRVPALSAFGATMH